MPENIQSIMAGLIIDDTDGLKELHDWLYEKVGDDNDIVVDKVITQESNPIFSSFISVIYSHNVDKVRLQSSTCL